MDVDGTGLYVVNSPLAFIRYVRDPTSLLLLQRRDGRGGEGRGISDRPARRGPKPSCAPRPREAPKGWRAAPSRGRECESTAEAHAGFAGRRTACGPHNERQSRRCGRNTEDFQSEGSARATNTRPLGPLARPTGPRSPHREGKVAVVGPGAEEVPAPALHSVFGSSAKKFERKCFCARRAQRSPARARRTHRV
jgi:hypothetical protein